MDDALGELAERTHMACDPHTLTILCADHGGGGMEAREHNSLHPLDQRIPIVLLGGAVRAASLTMPCSLLDVPATTCWALGITPPSTYSGRPLLQAFGGPDERRLALAAVA
jgi:arylsulfatase A-like enzyme